MDGQRTSKSRIHAVAHQRSLAAEQPTQVGDGLPETAHQQPQGAAAVAPCRTPELELQQKGNSSLCGECQRVQQELPGAASTQGQIDRSIEAGAVRRAGTLQRLNIDNRNCTKHRIEALVPASEQAAVTLRQ